jgi:hypothetical protein
MNLVWAVGGLVFALPAAPSVETAAGVTPPAVEAASEPVPAGAEVVRVKRDFGKPHFDLVIDAWADPQGGDAAAGPAVVVEHQRGRPSQAAGRVDRADGEAAISSPLEHGGRGRGRGRRQGIHVHGGARRRRSGARLCGDRHRGRQAHPRAAARPTPVCWPAGCSACRSGSRTSRSPARTTAAPCTAGRSPTASCDQSSSRQGCTSKPAATRRTKWSSSKPSSRRGSSRRAWVPRTPRSGTCASGSRAWLRRVASAIRDSK